MSFVTNLRLLKEIAEVEIPPLISAAGLTALDEYVYGGPSSAENNSLGFYVGPGDETLDLKNFKPVIQLQLPSISYETSLDYFDVVFDYLYGFDPKRAEMTSQVRVSYEEFPLDETSSNIYLIFMEYTRALEDCDN